MMAAKVLSAQYVKIVGDTSRVYMIGLDNGVEGEYFAPNGALPFAVGDSISFETKPSKFIGKPLHIKLIDTNVLPQMEILPYPNKKAYTKQGKDEAMISAVAICKSALEGRGLQIEDVKSHIEDLHHFFLNFKPRYND